MFPFFNSNFNNFNNRKSLEIKAPNGAIYRFSGNMIDDETFNRIKETLEHAVRENDQKLFDETWAKLQGPVNLNFNFDFDFEKFFKPFEQTLGGLFNIPSPENQNQHINIDEQIAHHQAEIKRLEALKAKENQKFEKEKIEGEIKLLREQLDDKLIELSNKLDNETEKQRLSKELTELHGKIKELEEKLTKFNE